MMRSGILIICGSRSNGVRSTCCACRPLLLRKFGHVRHGSSGSTNGSSGNGSSGNTRKLFGLRVPNVEWFSIPTSVGIACIAVLAFRRSQQRHKRNQARANETANVYNGIEVEDWKVGLAIALPTRSLSRAWGWVASLRVPEVIRRPVYGAFVWATGANMEEALKADIKEYESLVDLFKRKIKSELRPISTDAALVSPCDGKVVHVAEVDNSGMVDQVKGVSYPIHALFGPGLLPNWVPKSTALPAVADGKQLTAPEQTSTRTGNAKVGGRRLLQCIIYLSPADYHRYHSPTEWRISHRRHFAGSLLPVKLSMWSRVRGLMPLNERVVLTGSWCHGFFSYTTVGALNVGSMRFTFDDEFDTNQDGRSIVGFYRDKAVHGVALSHGSPVGEFRFGSTIALVFEAPADFKFCVKAGDVVRVGAPIGQID